MQSSSTVPPETVSEEAGNTWFTVRHSEIHGRGGFARCFIPVGTHLVEYIGERVTKEESSRRCGAGNPFIFTINDEWDIDGDVPGNPARFLNHSCAPNCEALQDGDRIWIVARRDIAAGEELTFNYGYDLSEWREYPCGCGAPGCLGYIVAEEHHDQIRHQIEHLRAADPKPPANLGA